MFTDKTMSCVDCGLDFMFSASEQEFYAERGFSEPRRCRSCRASRKTARGDGAGAGGGYAGGGFGGNRGASRGPREMFAATCSSCGREAQVPFRPTSGKPVYCDDCFSSRRR
ncbi:MAG: zinc-binding protein [Chloroflexi bacterium GWC2_73_18]|nr:MAG: zinc-binding protein [Chloroflexi bacterium GWC2_73_18]